jgi:hypothetical protein
MYKKHKWLSGLRGFRAFNQLRQICDLTVLFKALNLCLIANLAQCKLTDKYFKITYVSYTERYHTFEQTNEKRTFNINNWNYNCRNYLFRN